MIKASFLDNQLGCSREPAKGLVLIHKTWLVSTAPILYSRRFVLHPDLPMPWAKKGLANNHKICNASYWTRYGTDDFLGSDWLDQGLCLKPCFKYNNSLDPDGWLVRISLGWSKTDKREVTGARRGEHEAVLVVMSTSSKKGDFFARERCFFSWLAL